METRILRLSPNSPEQDKIKIAADLIKTGKLVAFPTETIYGLGANALNGEAIKDIFKAKGRPQDNPLIVHIADKEDLNKYVLSIPNKAKKLIDAFWPGPLTIVLKKNSIISNQVTCGLDSIAIRIPDNKIALELIKQSGCPIAAPSANISGSPSPTKAQHVFDDLNGKIQLILDGGDTDIGLESTVISLVNGPILLRPGKISIKEIEKIIGKIEVHKQINQKVNESEKPESPGLKYNHYCPKAKVILAVGRDRQDKIKYLKEKLEKEGKKVFIISDKNKEILAKNLFSIFRDCDKNKFDFILIEEIDENNLGMALMNRIRKAASRVI